jgi:hypothetical protein
MSKFMSHLASQSRRDQDITVVLTLLTAAFLPAAVLGVSNPAFFYYHVVEIADVCRPTSLFIILPKRRMQLEAKESIGDLS